MSDIIKDSSIWFSPNSFAAMNTRDPYLRIGIVQRVYLDVVSKDFRYLVQVQDRNDKIQTTCRYITRFGGVYNYEDVVYRGYSINDTPDPIQNLNAKAGDLVLVAFFLGEGREGVILGGLSHPARPSELNPDEGPQYQSEFNGIKTTINKDGEWTMTFRGQPTNLSGLSAPPSNVIPPPTYDTAIGTTFMKFDKTGGWTINDNAALVQHISVNKAAGTLSFFSGSVSTVMDKGAKSIVSKTSTYSLDASTSVSMKTKEWSVDAQTFVKIKSPKVAIGTPDIELLQQISDQLKTLISAFNSESSHTHIGNLGYPTAPPSNAGSMSSAASELGTIKGKIDSLKGAL